MPSVIGFSLFLVVFALNCDSIYIDKRASLCGSKKSTSACFCAYESEKHTGRPVYSMDCSFMRIENVPTSNQILGIEQLDLSFNSIAKLDKSESPLGSKTLISLDLSYNDIYYIGSDYFEDLTNLEVLDLSHNQISTFVNSNVFDGLDKLKVLDLSFNTISTLPEYIFAPMVSLRDLDVSYNYFGYVFDSVNNIYNATYGFPKNLEELKMAGMDFKHLSHQFFEGNNKLTHLDLADNPFMEIPTVPYSVTHLDLSGSLLTVLSGKHLNYHSLKVLKLNRLPVLQRIDRYAFYTLQSLEDLQLNYNPKLREIDSLAFGIISKNTEVHLKKLSVVGSGLQKINETYKYLFEELEDLRLEGNPFTCDCDILWLQEFKEVLYRQQIRCAGPTRLHMKSIMDLTIEDVPQCTEENHRHRVIVTVLSVLISLLVLLIALLIYLGPFYYQNKYRGIGPESPYNNNIDIRPNQAENYLR